MLRYAAAALVAVFLLGACGSNDATTSLRLEATNSFVGRATFTLRCDPPGGDVARPEEACARLAERPRALLEPKPFTCIGGTFSWWDLEISGRFDGRRVDVRTSTCWTPQMELIRRLGIAAQLQAHVDPLSRPPYSGSGIPRSALADVVDAPPDTPGWILRAGRLLARRLGDPHPRAFRVSLGERYVVTLEGRFVCDYCKRPLGVTEAPGEVARATFDRKTRLVTAFQVDTTTARLPCATLSTRNARLGRVAYVRSGSLRLLDLATCRDVLLARNARPPVRFSPDGRWIAFGAGATVATTGGPVQRLDAHGWAWAPRGHVLAIVTRNGGVRVGAKPVLPDGWGATDVRFAPDGSLFVTRAREIWVLLGPNRTPNQVAAFGSGTPELAAVSSQAVAFWLRLGKSNSIAADGLPLQVKRLSAGVAGPRVADASLLHPDYVGWCGPNLLFVGGGGRYATKGKQVRFATPPTWQSRDLSRDATRSWVSPACSPDLRWIVAAAGPNRIEARFGQESRSIWKVFTGRNYRLKLTSPPANRSDESPRWSGDGHHVLFVRSGPTRDDATALGSLYVTPAGGGKAIGPFARLGPTGNYYGHYGWSDLLDWCCSGRNFALRKPA
jgi:WD40 repeat protein